MRERSLAVTQITPAVVIRITLESTRTCWFDALYGYAPSAEQAKMLGLELDPQGYIKVDLTTMRTSVPLVYAAGDITGGMKQITVAVAQGSIAAMTAFEDIQAAFRKAETKEEVAAEKKS